LEGAGEDWVRTGALLFRGSRAGRENTPGASFSSVQMFATGRAGIKGIAPVAELIQAGA